MKTTLLFFSLFLLINNVFGQFNDVVEDDYGKILFQEVNNLDSLSKEKIYIKANEWFIKTFNDATSVIELNDKDEGVIMGKGKSGITVSGGFLTYNLYLDFTIKIEIQDYKYRTTFSELYYEEKYDAKYNTSPSKIPAEDIISPQNIDGKNPKLRQSYKTETLKIINALNINLKNYLNKKEDKW